MVKLTVYFAGDPSVGIFPYSFTIEVPEHSMENPERNYTIDAVKALYKELDGDGNTPRIYVEGERDE